MKIKNLLPLIGIAVLIYIITTLDFGKIIEVFEKIDPAYAFLSFFTLIPLLILVNIEWQLLLRRQKIHVSFWYSMKNFFIGYFYGFITPGGFGAYTRSLYLSEESGEPLPKCISNIIIFNAIEFVSLLVFGAIGALVLSSIYPYLFFAIIAVLIVIFLLYLFFFKKERSKKIFERLVRVRIFSTVRDRIENNIDSFYEDLPKFKDVLLPFGLSLAGWLLKFVILFFIAKLFLIEVPLVYFISIIAVGDVISSIPISIYGIGTRDAALITMFAVFGIAKEPVFSFTLFWFVVFWFAPSIVGALITVRESKKVSSFELNKHTTKLFEKYMKKYADLYRDLAKVVKKNISKKSKNPVIVDLGVGPGLLSKEMNNIIPDSEIVGVDPSQDMLNLAKKNAILKTALGSSEKIPLKDGFADVVVSRFSLTYWRKPKESFNEINRVLKPGGKVIIEALNKDFPKSKLFWIKVNMIFKGSGSDIAGYHADAYKTAYKAKDIERLLKISGFEIIKLDGEKKDWKYVLIAKKP